MPGLASAIGCNRLERAGIENIMAPVAWGRHCHDSYHCLV